MVDPPGALEALLTYAERANTQWKTCQLGSREEDACPGKPGERELHEPMALADTTGGRAW